MEEMSRRIMLAAILGVLVGVAIGYSPSAQRPTSPTAQLLMQQAGQTTVVPSAFRPTPSPGLTPFMIAILAGVVIAVPVFLVARRRAN